MALSCWYGYYFLTHFPQGFILLGAVFLCTTGADALYSDLGHCGLKNIQISWGYVKTTLLLNYFGQGAWILGLTINITMLMTTILLSVYLYHKKVPMFLIDLFLAVFLTIEGSFLTANLNKFIYGGWFTFLLGSLLFVVMFVWFSGRKIKNSFIEFVRIENYFEIIKELHKDKSVPKYANNLNGRMFTGCCM